MLNFFSLSLLLCCCCWTTNLIVDGDWTPPADPNPLVILTEAQHDTRAKNYQNALLKFSWYYENVLKIDPNQVGVRNSFALGYWDKLADVYQPAKDKLIQLRNDAETRVKSNQNVMSSFHDYLSLNDILKEQELSISMFKSLEKTSPEVTKKTYALLERTLIDHKEYEICGRYLEPEKSYNANTAGLKRVMEKSKTNPIMMQALPATKMSAAHSISQMVALLVILKRDDEAKKIVEKAKKDLDEPKHDALFDNALKGKMPPSIEEMIKSQFSN
jgi:hypothetical protein